MSRDWFATMRKASFKGVPFWVEKDGMQSGRRISVHEFAMRDNAFNEDLGRRQPLYSVNAYVGGEDVEARADALVNACTARGPGLLVLPFQSPVSVVCDDVNLQYNYDEIGICKITMIFIEDNGVRGGFQARVNPIRMAQVLAGNAFSAIGEAFAQRYNGVDGLVQQVGEITSIATEAAAKELAFGASVIYGALDGVETIPEFHADSLFKFDLLCRDAPKLSRQGHSGSKFRSDFFVKDGIEVTPEAGHRLAALASKTVQAAANKKAFFNNAITAIEVIDTPSALEEETTHASVSRRGRAVLLQSVRTTVRQSIAVMAMQAVAEAAGQVQTRREINRMRALLGERTTPILAEGFTSDEIAAISELRGRAAQTITEALTLRRPFRADENRQSDGLSSEVVVSAPRQLPATYWAFRLYGDTTRAEELVMRNEVPHPTFLPAEFEASGG